MSFLKENAKDNFMQKTILVVEDERPLLEAVKIKLQERGHKVLAYLTVDEAIDILKSGVKIDAVWLDHYLPGKNGLDVVIFMKEISTKYKHTPIFLVSNSVSSERIFQYLHLGVDGYFAKAESKLEDIVENIEQVIKDK